MQPTGGPTLNCYRDVNRHRKYVFFLALTLVRLFLFVCILPIELVAQVDLPASGIIGPSNRLLKSAIEKSDSLISGARACWGTSSVIAFRIGLMADKESYLTGQPVRVSLCVSNATLKSQHFGSSGGWPSAWDYIVTKDRGQKVNLTLAGKMRVKEIAEGGNASDFQGTIMTPGESFLPWRKDCVSEHYDLLVPGEYEIIAVYKYQTITNEILVRSGAIRVQIVDHVWP